MPAAATLSEARAFSAENIWGRFLAPVSLRTAFESWRDNGLSVLNPSVPEQAEARYWLVPTSWLIQELPPPVLGPGDRAQDVQDVEKCIEILSRTLDLLVSGEGLGGWLTIAQAAAILAAYNAAFA